MDLKQLMDHGFLIYKNGAAFTLKKLHTPTDSRTNISDEDFPSYEEALEAVAKHMQSGIQTWDAQVMWQHPGLGPQIQNLPQVTGKTYDEALAKAKKLAEGIKQEWNDIKTDVRVRPAQK